MNTIRNTKRIFTGAGDLMRSSFNSGLCFGIITAILVMIGLALLTCGIVAVAGLIIGIPAVILWFLWNSALAPMFGLPGVALWPMFALVWAAMIITSFFRK